MKKERENEKLLPLAKNGDKKASDELLFQNKGLILSVVRRFSGRGFEDDDLFQIGAMGFIKAVKRFDESYGVKLSTYAVPMIMGEIKRFIRDDGIIKVSRSIKELSLKVSSAREALVSEKGCEPSVSEIAERVGVPPEEIAAAVEATAPPQSLSAVSVNGNGESPSVEERMKSPECFEKKSLDRLLIAELLKDFPLRVQKIIILRYFREQTQAQIAKLLGISQVQVSRLEKNALEKMRKKLE